MSVINEDQPATFWGDDTASVTGVKIKTTIPEIKPVDLKFDYVTGSHETLVFLALQIERTQRKDIAIRAISSAVGILFKQKRDLLGGSGKQLTLSLLDDPAIPVESRSMEEVVGGEFTAGEKITAGEIATYMGDIDEIGSYFGVLFLAGIKRRTAKNREAFNAKRVPNIRATVNGELTIFVENSPLLSDEVLDTVYTAFNSFLANRMYLVRETVKFMAGTYVGPALSFQNMFVLLEDAGLGSLRVIKEAVLKYPFLRKEMPELASELAAANEGQKAIRRINQTERPFCKAIYGNQFVPISQNEIANLLGVCKLAMSFTIDSYRNFDGGNVAERQEEFVRRRIEQVSGKTLPIERDV